MAEAHLPSLICSGQAEGKGIELPGIFLAGTQRFVPYRILLL